jgi:valyl-tRNA synthetase
MIISGFEFKKDKPFKNVYLTGLVRDKQRRKMSKSLGNSPDALKLIDKYSADGVRVGLLLSSAAGNDLLFDEDLCQQGKSFSNKIWNSFLLIKGWQVKEISQPIDSTIALDWYFGKFQKALIEIEDHFSKYRLSDALMTIYKLIWDDYCSCLLEIIKPSYGEPIDKKTFERLVNLLEKNLCLLHPFMPFLSEEIWHRLKKRSSDQALIISKWPNIQAYDNSFLEDFKFANDVISSIRNLRKQKNIPFKKSIDLYVINNMSNSTQFDGIISKLGNLSKILYSKNKIEKAFSFRVKSNEYFVIADIDIDVNSEISKINEELIYVKGFLKSVQKKLSNKNFVTNAPAQVVASEKKKEADALAKIETLEMSLNSLK